MRGTLLRASAEHSGAGLGELHKSLGSSTRLWEARPLGIVMQENGVDRRLTDSGSSVRVLVAVRSVRTGRAERSTGEDFGRS